MTETRWPIIDPEEIERVRALFDAMRQSNPDLFEQGPITGTAVRILGLDVALRRTEDR